MALTQSVLPSSESVLNVYLRLLVKMWKLWSLRGEGSAESACLRSMVLMG